MAFSEAFLAWEQATEDRGREEGREEGHKAGLQAGQQAEKAAIALTLIQRQMPLAAIAEITGLSLEQIQALQKSPP
jgi:predicted transposase/invertase (TIGR01784 family)